VVYRKTRASARNPRRTALGVGLATVVLLSSSSALGRDPSLDVSQYAHTTWRIRDGFTRGKIDSIAQTTDGYLWLATDSGLLRFDGVRTVPWPPAAEGLPSSHVTVLAVGRDGTLWIGTAKGLASLRGGKLTNHPEVTGRLVRKLRADSDGTLWFAAVDTAGGQLAKLCAVESEKIRCEEPAEFGQGIFAIYPDQRGNLWVSATTGLWRWKPGPPEHYSFPAPIIEVNDLIEDDDGALLLATNDGLKRLADGRIQSHSFPGLAEMPRPVRFRRTRDGNLWIATFDGLVHVRQGKTDVFGVEDGLSHQYVMSLFEDREGNVWVNTMGGLDRFRAYRFPTIAAKQGLSASTWAVQATADGSVWTAATDGLYRWRDGHVTFHGKPAPSPSGGAERTATAPVLEGTYGSLAVDDRGRLWVANGTGVAYLEGNRFMRAPGLPARAGMHSLAADGHGNAWVSVVRVGLFRENGGGAVEELPWNRFGKSAGAAALLLDPARDGLWLGFTDGGVSHLGGNGAVTSYGAADGLGAGGVSHLRTDEQATVWAATEGGLSRIRDGHILTMTARNGLPCDAVHWSMDDEDKAVWLYMPCGLVRVSRSELDAWVKSPERTIRATVFDALDGVRTVGTLAPYGPPVTKAPDGKIWFTPLDGITVIDPRHLPHNDFRPPVHIEQITADGQVHDATAVRDGVLRLPPSVRDLEIDYTALSLAVPEKVRFRIKLEGQDQDFRELINERHVRYTNLPPGNYRFVVKAANDSDVWNEEGAFLDFTIPPAFHQATWFRALCAVAVAALLWAAYRIRVGVLERRQRLLIDTQEEERARIAGELHDGVLQQLSAVTFNLGAIKYQIPPGSPAKAEIAGAQDKLVEIGRDIRNLSHELHSAMLQEGGLARALSSYCVEFSKARGIDVSCTADAGGTALAPRAALALYRIAQEALGNVAKHANAKQIHVRLERADGVVRLTVSDDGTGFVPAASGESGGVGLVNMRARVRALEGRLEIESQPGRGTTIRADVPSRGAQGL
jgi:signal transduction histidine kinase/ligand-binding sensor domain-containing protein